MADPFSITAVFAFMNSALKFSEYAVKLYTVESENGVFVRLIQTVRQDLEETERLLTVPTVRETLLSTPAKIPWIKSVIIGTKSSLNDIGRWVERVRGDKEGYGSATWDSRIRWVFNDHDKLVNRQLELSTSHQALSTVLNFLIPLEKTTGSMETKTESAAGYQATVFLDEYLSPAQRRKKARRLQEASKKEDGDNSSVPRPQQSSTSTSSIPSYNSEKPAPSYLGGRLPDFSASNAAINQQPLSSRSPPPWFSAYSNNVSAPRALELPRSGQSTSQTSAVSEDASRLPTTSSHQEYTTPSQTPSSEQSLPYRPSLNSHSIPQSQLYQTPPPLYTETDSWKSTSQNSVLPAIPTPQPSPKLSGPLQPASPPLSDTSPPCHFLNSTSIVSPQNHKHIGTSSELNTPPQLSPPAATDGYFNRTEHEKVLDSDSNPALHHTSASKLSKVTAQPQRTPPSPPEKPLSFAQHELPWDTSSRVRMQEKSSIQPEHQATDMPKQWDLQSQIPPVAEPIHHDARWSLPSQSQITSPPESVASLSTVINRSQLHTFNAFGPINPFDYVAELDSSEERKDALSDSKNQPAPLTGAVSEWLIAQVELPAESIQMKAVGLAEETKPHIPPERMNRMSGKEYQSHESTYPTSTAEMEDITPARSSQHAKQQSRDNMNEVQLPLFAESIIPKASQFAQAEEKIVVEPHSMTNFSRSSTAHLSTEYSDLPEVVSHEHHYTGENSTEYSPRPFFRSATDQTNTPYTSSPSLQSASFGSPGSPYKAYSRPNSAFDSQAQTPTTTYQYRSFTEYPTQPSRPALPNPYHSYPAPPSTTPSFSNMEPSRLNYNDSRRWTHTPAQSLRSMSSVSSISTYSPSPLPSSLAQSREQPNPYRERGNSLREMRSVGTFEEVGRSRMWGAGREVRSSIAEADENGKEVEEWVMKQDLEDRQHDRQGMN